MRKQEIANSVAELFGKEGQLHLPEKAHHAIQSLSEVHSITIGAVDLLADQTNPGAQAGVSGIRPQRAKDGYPKFALCRLRGSVQMLRGLGRDD